MKKLLAALCLLVFALHAEVRAQSVEAFGGASASRNTGHANPSYHAGAEARVERGSYQAVLRGQAATASKSFYDDRGFNLRAEIAVRRALGREWFAGPAALALIETHRGYQKEGYAFGAQGGYRTSTREIFGQYYVPDSTINEMSRFGVVIKERLSRRVSVRTDFAVARYKTETGEKNTGGQIGLSLGYHF